MSPDDLDQALARWREAGVLSAAQAEAIRSLETRSGRLAAPSGEAGAAAPPPPSPARAQAAPPPPPPRPFRPAPAGAPPPARPAGRSAAASTGPLIDLAMLPPWARVDAAPLGLVLAILAALALAWGLFAVAVDFLVGPHAVGTTEVIDVAHLVAALLGLFGGAQMASAHPQGRLLALASLALNIAASVPLGLDRLVHGGTIVFVATWIVLAVLVLNSRFGREPASRLAP